MVNIVNHSFVSNHHRQNNIELAKELAEVRRQNTFLRDELNRRDIELTRLLSVESKYVAIKNIIEEDVPSRMAIEHEPILALPRPQPLTAQINSAIEGEQPSLAEETSKDLLTLREENSQEGLNSSYSDSLEPASVTSVPPLRPERIIHTPSIWKCLDSSNLLDDSSNQDDSNNDDNDNNGGEERDEGKSNGENLSIKQASGSVEQSGKKTLGLSTTLNLVSPIPNKHQQQKRLRADDNDMLQSTPIRAVPIQNNHENVEVVKNPKKARQPVAKRVADTEPCRYNLRKRTRLSRENQT